MPAEPDFARLAKRLISTAKRDTTAAALLFRQRLPKLVDHISRDAVRQGPLPFWGKSLNVDELAGLTIVDPSILDLLSEFTGRKLSHTIPHAGLQHTYGYLFSTIETPYGFKRDRWISTELEDAFGLHETTLGAQPTNGTLLANATWLSGQIAFRGSPAQMRRLASSLQNRVAPELLDWTVPKTHTRLLERVTKTVRGVKRAWTLQTDLVKAKRNSSFCLLVYSIVDHHTKTQKLITLFPMSPAGVQELIDRGQTVRQKDIRPRYNAYIGALSGHILSGTCRLKRF